MKTVIGNATPGSGLVPLCLQLSGERLLKIPVLIICGHCFTFLAQWQFLGPPVLSRRRWLAFNPSHLELVLTKGVDHDASEDLGHVLAHFGRDVNQQVPAMVTQVV